MPNLGLKDLSNIILSRGVLIFGVFLPQQETIFTFLNKRIKIVFNNITLLALSTPIYGSMMEYMFTVVYFLGHVMQLQVLSILHFL
jgi:hypothetical protein